MVSQIDAIDDGGGVGVYVDSPADADGCKVLMGMARFCQNPSDFATSDEHIVGPFEGDWCGDEGCQRFGEHHYKGVDELDGVLGWEPGRAQEQ